MTSLKLNSITVTDGFFCRTTPSFCATRRRATALSVIIAAPTAMEKAP